MDVASKRQTRSKVEPQEPRDGLFQLAGDGVAILRMECGAVHARNAAMGWLALCKDDLPAPAQHVSRLLLVVQMHG
jgi:hypothetical protein